jgi:hypothetical protein
MHADQTPLAEQDTTKPVTLHYASTKLRGRRHGGPGDDWWALWALGLWFVVVGALASVATYFSRR